MKKVFVSVPMRGRSLEAIQKSQKTLLKIASAMVGEPLEMIETAQPVDPNLDDGTSRPIWCIGRSIQWMAKADYFIGVYTEAFEEPYHGCDVEYMVAENYGIPVIELVDPELCACFEDIFEEDDED